MLKQKLRTVGRDILNSDTKSDEIRASGLLSDFFLSAIDPGFLESGNESLTVTGSIALSSFDASICVDDYLRTARFIKGIHAAIGELKTRFPEGKINILYAGCGPYATLLLPLLPLFGEDELDIVLLDINPVSIASVGELLPVFGLQDYHIKMAVADAITYKVNTAWPLHLLISETMFEALIREPQVLITKNLAKQLHPDGILIPEAISIDLGYSFFSNEPYLKTASNPASFEKMIEPYVGRREMGHLFSLNKELDFFNCAGNVNSVFESDFYELPANFDDCPDICLFTSLTIFRNIQLHSAESYITNPYCITSLFNTAGHTHFKLAYHFEGIPKWAIQLKKG